MRPHFTLTVVSSVDGFIATHSGHAPQDWASREEQGLFLADVEAADWAILGRGTHEAVNRPDRRRIVFSSSGGHGIWRLPNQVWIDPAEASAQSLAGVVAGVYPLLRGIVLGGTRVHDWFLAQSAIDRVHLTIEPVRFGRGLPIFGSQRANDPRDIFREAGFEPVSERLLNASGTSFIVMEPVSSGSEPGWKMR